MPVFGTLEFSPVAQFVIDGEHRIQRWNRACEIMTGYSCQEMVGSRDHWKPFYDKPQPTLADLVLSRDHDPAAVSALGGKAKPSGKVPNAWEFAGYFPAVGGRRRHLHVLAAAVLDAAGNTVGAVETLIDTTEQKNNENALIQSKENYKKLAQDLSDGFLLVQDGVMVMVNSAFAKMLGYSDHRELEGVRPETIIAPSHREIFLEKIGLVRAGVSEIRRVQWPHITKDGREIWIEGHPKLVTWDNKPTILTSLIDITEAKNQEKALNEAARRLKQEVRTLKASMKERYRFSNIIGKSPAMQVVYEMILKAASNNASVIIYGESGTGKELVAKAVHNMSSRHQNFFVPVNCGAIPENLMESEFFGYKKGAFTGASGDKAGFLDRACNGTLFLDEIGELSPAMQAKLLRAIETQAYHPVGSPQIKKSDFNLIAATNKNLLEQVKLGTMREDFFYRIHIVPIHLPSLRERKEDIPLLVEHFLRIYSGDKAPPILPAKVMEQLYDHDWPGNVRELQNTIHRYLAIGSVDLLPNQITPISSPLECGPLNMKRAVQHLEERMIARALQESKGNKSQAADLLGIPRKTLYRKLDGIESKRNKPGQFVTV